MSHGEVRLIDGKRVASPEYRAWQAMKNRCHNPRAPDYRYYGARGVAVCDEWRASFDAFLRDMGRRPAANLTLDRIDTARGYEPGNCRWATRQVQSRNRPYANVKAWELAEQLGVSHATVYQYLWQIRRKDKGLPSPAHPLSAAREAQVRTYLEKPWNS